MRFTGNHSFCTILHTRVFPDRLYHYDDRIGRACYWKVVHVGSRRTRSAGTILDGDRVFHRSWESRASKGGAYRLQQAWALCFFSILYRRQTFLGSLPASFHSIIWISACRIFVDDQLNFSISSPSLTGNLHRRLHGRCTTTPCHSHHSGPIKRCKRLSTIRHIWHTGSGESTEKGRTCRGDICYGVRGPGLEDPLLL